MLIVIILMLVMGLGIFIYFNKQIERLKETITQPSVAEKEILREEVFPEEISPAKEEVLTFEELMKIPEEAWKEVTSFSGKESQKTKSFFIPGNQCRIKWELESFPEEIGCIAYQVQQLEGDRIVTSGSICSDQGEDYSSGISYISTGKTTFYLKIEITDLKTWKAKIETL